MKSKRYKKKPVIIEALQWNGNNFKEIKDFTNKSFPTKRIIKQSDDTLLIHTLEGDMKVDKNDFIIKGIQGEFYPCKPDIFRKTYESID